MGCGCPVLQLNAAVDGREAALVGLPDAAGPAGCKELAGEFGVVLAMNLSHGASDMLLSPVSACRPAARDPHLSDAAHASAALQQ